MEQFRFACPCNFGLESVLSGELKRMGAKEVTAADGRVDFSGTAEDLAGYGDAAYVDAYARGAVTCLLQQGILPANGSSISPKGNLTRAAMAVLLHRAMAK